MAGKIVSGITKATATAATATAAIEGAQKVWATANKDGALAQKVTKAKEWAAAKAQARTPLAALERALDAADQAIAEFQPDSDADRDALTHWQREAATLRSKMTPLQGKSGADQRRRAADLRGRADRLLNQILDHGLEPTRRRLIGLPGRR